MSAGSRTPHDSATLHVTGHALYTDDVPMPANTVHLAFGISAEARARIADMDLSSVRNAAGVVAVLTADDIPGTNDTSPSAHDEPLLAEGEVFYHGQPLFLVAATSHNAARRAARLAKVTYETRPAILTIDDALAAGSHFEDGPVVWERGDPDAPIDAAPHRIEGQIEVGGQEHFYLEGQVAAAVPGDNGGMTILSSSQHPTEIQHKVAETLALPFAAITVETRRMGGGFGGKESQGNALAAACALIAHKTGRSAKMRYDRDDDMVITGKRHDIRVRYRAGFDDEGRLTGIDFTHDIRCGWSQDLSLPVADRAMLHADNAYYLPAVRITSRRLKTHTTSATAFRGFGGPQGMVGIERVMDHIAATLNCDPLDIRMANLYRPNNLETPYGQMVEDNILHELIGTLAESGEYVKRRRDVAQFNSSNQVFKRGLALTPVKFGISFTLTHLNQAGALVHIYTDGSVHLNHGGTEMGQGLNTKVAQVAATELGLPLSAVRITATNTSKVPNTSATAASSGSDLNGMACKAACETLRNRLTEFAAEQWQTDPANITFVEGSVMIGSETMAFADLVAKAYEDRVQLSATGFYATPGIEWDRIRGRGRPFFYFAYGAALTEVIINSRTGESRILRADVLHDVGRSLNPVIDIGQIEGGYVQGAGWLMTEELVWDQSGRLSTHAPSTYKIPACSDRPVDFRVALWDGGENRAETIYRSKAVGEPPFMLGISAFMALSDAIASCGTAYPALNAPATPETISRTVRSIRA